MDEDFDFGAAEADLDFDADSVVIEEGKNNAMRELERAYLYSLALQATAEEFHPDRVNLVTDDYLHIAAIGVAASRMIEEFRDQAVERGMPDELIELASKSLEATLSKVGSLHVALIQEWRNRQVAG